MSGNQSMPEDSTPDAPRRSRRWLVALVALAVVVVLAIVLVSVNRSGSGQATGATTETAAAAEATSTDTSDPSEATGPSEATEPAAAGDPSDEPAEDSDPEASDPGTDAATAAPVPDTPATDPPTEADNLHLATVDQPVKDPVDLNGTADLGGGITAAVTDLQAVQGEAQGIGEIAGPALKFTLTVTNGTDQAVPLSDAIVNVTYGPDNTPASPLSGPGPVPFPPSVDAKGSAAGTFIFAIPADSRDSVKILLNYSVAAPIAAFAGPVPKP
ncbi:MAG: hypothetical protein JWO93_2828 [Micrococcaceae bacterium]|nr:hypothetical protein [Micrococcaceae bacterium]